MNSSTHDRQALSLLVLAANDHVIASVAGAIAAAGGASYRLQHVSGSAELQQALHEQAWDAVLDCEAAEPAAVARTHALIELHGSDLPLLVVVAKGNGAGIGELMAAGARDVIEVDRLARLLPAIEREVGEARHRADHRAALQMLDESQARFEALASNLPGMLFHLRRDEQGVYRFLFVSEGCHKLFGFKQQHLLASAEKLFDAFDTERRKSLEGALRESAEDGTLLNWEGHTRGRTRQKWINLRSTPHRFENGVVEWRGIATNITESKENEAELRGSRQQLAELSSHLEAAKEEERERISRDIHDELGSILVFLKIEAAQLLAKLPPDAQRLREKALSIETMLGQAMSTASRVARELRPGILKEFGLAAAIECQAEDFVQRFGIPCRVQCAEDVVEPEPDTALGLFRIAQEALTNVAKHAHASLVVMRLGRERGNILLEIRDNGRGISALDMQKPRSFGLRGIRERVASLGGEFSIEPGEHGGTHLVLRVPEVQGSEPPTEEELQRKLF
jgi:signal transduction histidine kinase